MRIESIVISMISLLLGGILLLLGTFFVAAPYYPLFCHKMSLLLAEPGRVVVEIGVVFLLLSLLLLTAFYGLNKRRYLLIRMGECAIHENVLSELAKRSLAEIFPAQDVFCDVIVKRKGRVEILANIPYVRKENQKETLQQIEAKLSKTMASQCGFYKEFLFNVSFQKQ
ncbi:MAG: hypothetical protein ACKVOH_00050 [Chlamydiales bacterium]